MRNKSWPSEILSTSRLCVAAATILLTAGTGFCGDPHPQVLCEGTIEAWRHDRSMKQYMNDYECSCSNGSSSPPVCRSRNAGAETPAGGSGGGKRGPSDQQIALREIQNYMDSMFKVNRQAYEKYRQTSLQSAQQIHRNQQAAARSEEERRMQAAREEAALRDRTALEVHTELLGMPSGGDNHILDLTGALDEDTRKKQLAECPGIAEKIDRYRNGIRRIEEIMAKNDRFIRDAEEDGKKAEEELSKVSADAAAETLSMGLKSFVQTQKNLQTMRNALDKLNGSSSSRMSYDQIVQAKKWLDRGLSRGQDVIDLTEKNLQYYKTTSLRGNAAFQASPFNEKLKTALSDFNEKFMYDAGGWEFVGEHLAEAGGGIGGEIAFKAAVAGIKATAAGIGMKISRDQLRVYNENQDKMAVERYRLERRIEELQTSFVNNRCPKQ